MYPLLSLRTMDIIIISYKVPLFLYRLMKYPLLPLGNFHFSAACLELSVNDNKAYKCNIHLSVLKRFVLNTETKLQWNSTHIIN